METKDFLTSEDGVEITEEVREIIKKAVEEAGNAYRLGNETGMPYQNIRRWMGLDRTGRHLGVVITWPQVLKLRPFLEEHGLVDKGDVMWMTPDERRTELIRLREEYRKKQEKGVMENGTGNEPANGGGGASEAI